MLGAGIFAALTPAAAAAGSWLLVGLAIAAAVAYCNATSSARLAALYPQSGGTYVYGRERLGPVWGHAAGWSFVVGKTASCAAMALTVGAYAWPDHARAVAVAVVLVLTAVNVLGVQKSALLTRIIVVVVIAALCTVVVAIAPRIETGNLALTGSAGVGDVLQSAGLLFFAFAGYARIATLGEEVRNPEVTIPRSIAISLGIALTLYAAVAVSVLGVLGGDALGTATAPLAAAVEAAGHPWLAPVVRVAAVVAATGALLALILGVSRTALAMARDRYLPSGLSAVHPRFGSPHRAEITVGVVVAALAALVDLRGAIGFSSFAVLIYYSIANAAAFTLRGKLIPVLGLVGCVVLAVSLPWQSVLAGSVVVLCGFGVFSIAHRTESRRNP
ncbi:APC family permease [Mycolicibacterium sp. CAU 1645]|uniref:APC family permease n=2 Tax=Mycolicibacterium arenosum TaxID=2952157 RepID=A0ABT1LYM7_9MYCO|nr:APC family permease [Mycolicibacterium sp. CAU 1645]